MTGIHNPYVICASFMKTLWTERLGSGQSLWLPSGYTNVLKPKEPLEGRRREWSCLIYSRMWLFSHCSESLCRLSRRYMLREFRISLINVCVGGTRKSREKCFCFLISATRTRTNYYNFCCYILCKHLRDSNFFWSYIVEVMSLMKAEKLLKDT